MGVDPSNRHEALSHLTLEKLDLVIHGAHVLFTSLGRNDECRDHKLSILLFSTQDGACLDFGARVGVGNSQELRNDLDWTNDGSHASHWSESALLLLRLRSYLCHGRGSSTVARWVLS